MSMKRLLSLIIFLLPLFTQAQYISGCGPYTTSGPITLTSNTTISGKLIDLAGANTVGITGNGVTNVHITKCKIINNTNFGILLNGCTNITIDSCYIANVGFGVYAQSGSSQIKVNGNYFLNINGISTAFLGHAVQFNGVNGGGSQINNNRVENIAGVAIHPHDMLNVYQSNGLPGDSIQVIGNWIRGGQYYFWPDANSGAAGIIMGDVGGSYQVCRNNILVNTGYSGIQCNGTGAHIKIDHNQMFSTYAPVSHQAITILDANQIECSYNQTNWTNYNNLNVLYSDGETQYYLGSTPSPTPVGFNTNTWKANITANILPASLIPVCGTTATRPNIAYNPTIYIFTVGVSASIGAPTNTGGNGTFSVSPALPAGLTLSPTGAISGVPSIATAQAIYTVSCTNSGGTSSVGLQITVNNPVVVAPKITYSPNSISPTVNTTITPLSASNTGGSIVGWSVSPSPPIGIVFNSGTFSGTPSVVQTAQVYTVTASNSGGSSSALVTITVLPVKPAISYTGSPYTFTQGSTIVPLTASNSGGAGTFSGSLPAGLTLNSSTGQITGTCTTIASATNYVISCTNAAGVSQATLNITVQAPAVVPPAISYSPNSITVTINNAIPNLAPTNTGGAATSYSCSPSPPTGIIFSTANGTFTGIPTVTSATTSYSITGTNSGGTSPITHVSITVNQIAAPSITYPYSSVVYVQGTPISPISPTNSGGQVTTYSISSGSLPNGVVLDPVSGVVSGTPLTTQSPTNFTVHAVNAGGSSDFTIQAAVNIPINRWWYIVDGKFGYIGQ